MSIQKLLNAPIGQQSTLVVTFLKPPTLGTTLAITCSSLTQTFIFGPFVATPGSTVCYVNTPATRYQTAMTVATALNLSIEDGGGSLWRTNAPQLFPVVAHQIGESLLLICTIPGLNLNISSSDAALITATASPTLGSLPDIGESVRLSSPIEMLKTAASMGSSSGIFNTGGFVLDVDLTGYTHASVGILVKDNAVDSQSFNIDVRISHQSSTLTVPATLALSPAGPITLPLSVSMTAGTGDAAFMFTVPMLGWSTLILSNSTGGTYSPVGCDVEILGVNL